MYALEISFYAQTQKFLFAERSDAEAQLDLIKPLLGKGQSMLNRDESDVHTVVSDCGRGEVVLNKIECARVVDVAEVDALTQAEHDRRSQLDIDHAVSKKRALMALNQASQPTDK